MSTGLLCLDGVCARRNSLGANSNIATLQRGENKQSVSSQTWQDLILVLLIFISAIEVKETAKIGFSLSRCEGPKVGLDSLAKIG